MISIHASTTAETLVKSGSVVVEIFGEIGQFFPYRLWPYNFFHLKLWNQQSKSHQIFTSCAEMIAY